MEDLKKYEWQLEIYKKIMAEATPRKVVSKKDGKEYLIKNPNYILKKVAYEHGEEMATIFKLGILNNKDIPRYHIRDDEHPHIVDIYTAYPKQFYGDLKFLYDNGYVWLISTKKGKLFTTMHGCTDNLAEINGVLADLIIKRETPFNL